MEYVKILCCGKENGELGTLSLLLDRMTSNEFRILRYYVGVIG